MNVDHNWFNATTWALRDWETALRGWQMARYDARPDLTAQRENYRRRILSWYFALLTPMALGDAVPNEVALLLAEVPRFGESRTVLSFRTGDLR